MDEFKIEINNSNQSKFNKMKISYVFCAAEEQAT
jgi:hypothetical protein